MSYRDDLGQAHERIAQLERELAGERAKGAPSPGRRSPRGLLLMLGMVLLLAGGVTAFWTMRRAPDDVIRVRPLEAVVRDQARYRGERMRVEGELVPGKMTSIAEPCEMTMVLERANAFLTVHLPHCNVPDLFRADRAITVVAEGELRSDGIFEAKQILVPVPKL